MLFICSNQNLERGKSLLSSLSGDACDYLAKHEDLNIFLLIDPRNLDPRSFLVSPRQVIEFFSVSELDVYLSELYFQEHYA